MDIHSRDAWERLGTELRKRRGELGYGSRERKRFAADTGLHYRLVQRIETGEREGYPPETVAQVESAYQLERDAVGAFFTTGHLAVARIQPGERGPAPLTAQDVFEERVLAADLPYPERAAAIRRHRELAQRMLDELGITEPPAPLQEAVRRYLGGSEHESDGERRGA